MIFDEASAIVDKIWEVSEGALTDEATEIIWLAFGNPTRNTGRFRECFGRFRHRWDHGHIDSRLVEGTNEAQLEQWVRDYGEDSDFVRVRVKGVFPHAGSMQFISSALVELAMSSERAPRATRYDPLIMGVDVARFGDDRSVIRFRRGRDGRSMRPIKLRGVDTMQLAARIADENARYPCDAIFIDGGGVGGGVVDRCRQLGLRVIEVQFGARSVSGLPARVSSSRPSGRRRLPLIKGARALNWSLHRSCPEFASRAPVGKRTVAVACDSLLPLGARRDRRTPPLRHLRQSRIWTVALSYISQLSPDAERQKDLTARRGHFRLAAADLTHAQRANVCRNSPKSLAR